MSIAPHQCVSCLRTDETVRACNTCGASVCSFDRAGDTCVCCSVIGDDDYEEAEDD